MTIGGIRPACLLSPAWDRSSPTRHDLATAKGLKGAAVLWQRAKGGDFCCIEATSAEDRYMMGCAACSSVRRVSGRGVSPLVTGWQSVRSRAVCYCLVVLGLMNT